MIGLQLQSILEFKKLIYGLKKHVIIKQYKIRIKVVIKIKNTKKMKMKKWKTTIVCKYECVYVYYWHMYKHSFILIIIDYHRNKWIFYCILFFFLRKTAISDTHDSVGITTPYLHLNFHKNKLGIFEKNAFCQKVYFLVKTAEVMHFFIFIQISCRAWKKALIWVRSRIVYSITLKNS